MDCLLTATYIALITCHFVNSQAQTKVDSTLMLLYLKPAKCLALSKKIVRLLLLSDNPILYRQILRVFLERVFFTTCCEARIFYSRHAVVIEEKKP